MIASRLDFLTNNNFNPLKPGIFLAKIIRDLLNDLEPFTTIFNGNIYDYYRDDTAQMTLPTMCINIGDTKSSGKYYYLWYPIAIDIFLPLDLSHYSEATARQNIMALLDTFFKRNDIQAYLSRMNYGLMDIAGLKPISEVANLSQLDGSRATRIMSFSCYARIDRLLYNKILIERFGVNPADLIPKFVFPILQDVRPQFVEPITNLPIGD